MYWYVFCQYHATLVLHEKDKYHIHWKIQGQDQDLQTEISLSLKGVWSNFSRLRGVVPIVTCAFYTRNWLTLTPKTHFAQFYLKLNFYFLSCGKNMYLKLGMRLLWKYIRKSKMVCTRRRYIFCYNSQSKVNLKLKFRGYNEKNMGFHLTHKKWTLGDKNVISIRAFNCHCQIKDHHIWLFIETYVLSVVYLTLFECTKKIN